MGQFIQERLLQNPSLCPLEAGHSEGFCKSLKNPNKRAGGSRRLPFNTVWLVCFTAPGWHPHPAS